jgi:hypothetical protein
VERDTDRQHAHGPQSDPRKPPRHRVPYFSRSRQTVYNQFNPSEKGDAILKTTFNLRSVTYWTTTVLLAFCIGSGGAAEFLHLRPNVEGMRILGYPVYFMTILGFWKALGAVAILAPRFPRLKEWAYAGIFFNVTGAAASHAAVGDYGVYAFHVVVTLFFAVLAIASWALRPPSRTLGVLPAVGIRSVSPAVNRET